MGVLIHCSIGCQDGFYGMSGVTAHLQCQPMKQYAASGQAEQCQSMKQYAASGQADQSILHVDWW